MRDGSRREQGFGGRTGFFRGRVLALAPLLSLVTACSLLDKLKDAKSDPCADQPASSACSQSANTGTPGKGSSDDAPTPSSDGCEGVSCEGTPSSTCTDEHTLTTYSGSGTCKAGQCTYAHTTTDCPLGCQGSSCCADSDGDGYTTCDGDCNDADPSVHPGATDVPDDGIDQDCSGKDRGSCSDDVLAAGRRFYFYGGGQGIDDNGNSCSAGLDGAQSAEFTLPEDADCSGTQISWTGGVSLHAMCSGGASVSGTFSYDTDLGCGQFSGSIMVGCDVTCTATGQASFGVSGYCN